MPRLHGVSDGLVVCITVAARANGEGEGEGCDLDDYSNGISTYIPSNGSRQGARNP